MAKVIVRTLSTSVKLFAGFHLFLQYGYEVHGTFGPNKWHHRHGKDMHVGDLIVAGKPGDPDTFILKRLLGAPGDIVLRDPLESSNEYVKVPPGHFWIVGDNLPHSTDSRHYGPIPMGLVKGRVLGTVYPNRMWFTNGLQEPHVSPIARGYKS